MKPEPCAQPEPVHSLKETVIKALAARGVLLGPIAEIVLALQKPYNPDLTLEECLEAVDRVLDKREVQHAVLTGLCLDVLAERCELPEPLLTIVREDEPLFGIDEILALSIVNVYGSVGLTSFGYLDKVKTGILERINRPLPGTVNTFLDDLVAGIAAAAGARIAHQGEERSLNGHNLAAGHDMFHKGGA
ncbi:MAG: phosphatidylglycerophosphatase A [Bacillota bacterium]|nr:phosphatidylglycerophosphatase A [Bacillota bacterium]